MNALTIMFQIPLLSFWVAKESTNFINIVGLRVTICYNYQTFDWIINSSSSTSHLPNVRTSSFSFYLPRFFFFFFQNQTI